MPRMKWWQVNGWLNVSNVHYLDFAREMEKVGVKTIIFTDISRDGTLSGPNLEQLKKLQETVSCNIIRFRRYQDH